MSIASLRASSLFMQTSTSTSSSRCSSCKPTRISAAIHVPKMPNSLRVAAPMSSPGASSSRTSFVEDHKTAILESIKQQSRPLSPSSLSPSSSTSAKNNNNEELLIMSEVYMILEAVSDRAEIHRNVGEQRNNWNTLLLNSINMMTLTATAMTGLAECEPAAHVGLSASSFVLFTAAAGMLAIMNKIQPSQLAEEQRNATRLFKRLEQEIRTLIALKRATKADVESLMGRVLALDRAYPLPLLGAMIEKFPSQFKPARWWPEHENENPSFKTGSNGWSGALESRMRDVVRVIKAKDSEEYRRLGSRALELNKALAVTGPALTGIAALASAFATNHSTTLGSVAATVAGALACAVNSLEHGGQVGMVAEMYRNCAGQLEQMEESIESAAAGRREHGEVFEMKVALQLGRSMSELRHLARKSSSCGGDGSAVDEFASKLF